MRCKHYGIENLAKENEENENIPTRCIYRNRFFENTSEVFKMNEKGGISLGFSLGEIKKTEKYLICFTTSRNQNK